MENEQIKVLQDCLDALKDLRVQLLDTNEAVAKVIKDSNIQEALAAARKV